MLYGDFKNYLVAILVPNKDLALEWAKENNVEGDLKKIVQESLFNKKIKDVVDKVNKSLSSIEQIRIYFN